MARKNIIPSHSMLQDVDITTDQTSESTNVAHLDRASVSIDWTGSDAVGEIQFEAKKQENNKALPDADWRALDFGSTIDITGASGSHEVIFDALDFTDLRVKFVSTSGTTGTLTAVLTAKQIGG
jgi:hypothetical protein